MNNKIGLDIYNKLVSRGFGGAIKKAQKEYVLAWINAMLEHQRKKGDLCPFHQSYKQECEPVEEMIYEALRQDVNRAARLIAEWEPDKITPDNLKRLVVAPSLQKHALRELMIIKDGHKLQRYFWKARNQWKKTRHEDTPFLPDMPCFNVLVVDTLNELNRAGLKGKPINPFYKMIYNLFRVIYGDQADSPKETPNNPKLKFGNRIQDVEFEL